MELACGWVPPSRNLAKSVSRLGRSRSHNRARTPVHFLCRNNHAAVFNRAHPTEPGPPSPTILVGPSGRHAVMVSPSASPHAPVTAPPRLHHAVTIGDGISANSRAHSSVSASPDLSELAVTPEQCVYNVVTLQLFHPDGREVTPTPLQMTPHLSGVTDGGRAVTPTLDGVARVVPPHLSGLSPVPFNLADGAVTSPSSTGGEAEGGGATAATRPAVGCDTPHTEVSTTSVTSPEPCEVSFADFMPPAVAVPSQPAGATGPSQPSGSGVAAPSQPGSTISVTAAAEPSQQPGSSDVTPHVTMAPHTSSTHDREQGEGEGGEHSSVLATPRCTGGGRLSSQHQPGGSPRTPLR